MSANGPISSWARAGRRGDRTAGVTLPEVLIALVVLAVLLAVALPGFEGAARRSRLGAAARQLAGDLERARTLAVKGNRGITVAVTGSSSYAVESVGTRQLDGVAFVEAPDSVRFAPFGPPLTGPALFVLGAGDRRDTVVVGGAGFVEAR